MASSMNTLLRTIEWSKKLNFGRGSATGVFLEPALTSGNTIIQTMLGPPFAWRWNRVVTGFITTAGQQDYTLVTWQPGIDVPLGAMAIDDHGNCQQVVTDGTTGGIAPTWNQEISGATSETSPGTALWRNLGPVGTPASQTYNLGFIETVSVQDKVLGAPKWFEIENKLCLSSDSSLGRPRYISAQSEDAFGNITFRLTPVPDTVYPVSVTMQQKPPLFTSLSQTWAPIPDEYAHIYNWGFLSLMWQFADDPRFGMANQKFIAQLLSTAEGLSETERNIFLQGWQHTSGQPIANMDRLQQGHQARGM